MRLQFFNDEWELFVDHCGFTDEESEIVAFLRRGWACVDIAEELGVSLSTINRRKNRIKQKILRYITNAS